MVAFILINNCMAKSSWGGGRGGEGVIAGTTSCCQRQNANAVMN